MQYIHCKRYFFEDWTLFIGFEANKNQRVRQECSLATFYFCEFFSKCKQSSHGSIWINRRLNWVVLVFSEDILFAGSEDSLQSSAF